MPDYLDALIARSLDAPLTAAAAPIAPRLPSRFEPVKTARAGDLTRTASDGLEESQAAIARLRDARVSASDPLDAAGDRRTHANVDSTPADREGARGRGAVDDDLSPSSQAPRSLPSRLGSLEDRLSRDTATTAAQLQSLSPAPSRWQADGATAEQSSAAPVTVSASLDQTLDTIARAAASAVVKSTRLDASQARQAPRQPPASASDAEPGQSGRTTGRVDALTMRLDSLAQQVDGLRILAPASGGVDRRIELSSEPETARTRERASHRDRDLNVDRDQRVAIAPRPARAERRDRATSQPRAQHQTYVEVTIGRIELHAAPPESSSRQAPARTETVAPTTLDDYLRRRNGAVR